MRERLVFEGTLHFSIAFKNDYLEKNRNSFKKLCLKKNFENFEKSSQINGKSTLGCT